MEQRRGSTARDARARAEPDARRAQPRDAGVVRDGVQPRAPLGDRRGAGRALPPWPGGRTSEPERRGAAAGVSRRGAAHAAAERWHRDDRGRALRGAVALPDPGATERAVCVVGPVDGPSRRRAQRCATRAAVPTRSHQERHAVTAHARGGREHDANRGGGNSVADDNPEMAPLLRQLITSYDRAGLPPAYVPKDEAP